MAGWSRHDGLAAGLALENVDTDQLIPARFMSIPRSEGYGDHLLHDLRRGSDGALDPAFALNQSPGASVLIARRNFGCGSSREAAVYALVDAGIRAVIAPSFGDIFAGNAINNGLLPAQVSVEAAEALLALAPCPLAIDIAARQIAVAGQPVLGFELADQAATKLENGWDDIDLTRAEAPQIAAYRARLQGQRPWVWPQTER